MIYVFLAVISFLMGYIVASSFTLIYLRNIQKAINKLNVGLFGSNEGVIDE